jgi:hypothetical protein
LHCIFLFWSIAENIKMALVLIDVVITPPPKINIWLPGRYLPPRDTSIPLTSVEIKGSIIDFVGKIRVTQTYINKYARNIEAKYLFNLDENSTVTGMSMIIGDRVLASHIEEKSQARQTYETAISEKKTTSLLEKAANGIYTMNVGNILPNQEVKIEFEYLTKLECTEEGQMKFVLPTNISPKYDDQQKTVSDMMATRSTTTPMVHSGGKSPFNFHVDLTWRSSNPILEVKSFTNEIEVTPFQNYNSPNEAATGVQITCKTAPSNGDFNVLVTTAIQPTIYVHTKGEETFLMVNQRIPDEYHDLTGGDFTIIVDRSGSMGDPFNSWSENTNNTRKTKMDYAREATELFVQSLPAGSKFNIVSFGTTYNTLFPSSVAYTEETKRQALKEIKGFQSNMGGTELFKCLSDVLSGERDRNATTGTRVDLAKRARTPSGSTTTAFPNSEGRQTFQSKERIIILMTDGDVGNVDAVTSLIRSYNHVSRVFAIGIGQDVNRFLVDKVAKSSNACSEILVDNPDISTVVAKMLDASTKSYYKNISMNITYNGGEGGMMTRNELVQINKVVYPTQFVSFFHKLSTRDFLTCSAIQLSCQNGITELVSNWSFAMNHSEDSSQENSSIPQLYAADYINSLEENNADNRWTSEIIRTSVAYSIMNARTSFVVVDEQTLRAPNYSNYLNPLPVTVPQHSGAATVGTGNGVARRLTSSRSRAPAPVVTRQQQSYLVQTTTAAMPRFSGGAMESGGGGRGGGGGMFSMNAPEKKCKAGSRARSPPRFADSRSDERDLDRCYRRESAQDDVYDEMECDSGAAFEETVAVNMAFPPPAPPASTAGPVMAEMRMNINAVSSLSSSSLTTTESISTRAVGEQKMDVLFQYKKVDGSFSYSPTSLHILGWSNAAIASFASSHGISEEMAFNLWILKFLRSDLMKSSKKYVMIIRNLERWVNEQMAVQAKGRGMVVTSLLTIIPV